MAAQGTLEYTDVVFAENKRLTVSVLKQQQKEIERKLKSIINQHIYTKCYCRITTNQMMIFNLCFTINCIN